MAIWDGGQVHLLYAYSCPLVTAVCPRSNCFPSFLCLKSLIDDNDLRWCMITWSRQNLSSAENDFHSVCSSGVPFSTKPTNEEKTQNIKKTFDTDADKEFFEQKRKKNENVSYIFDSYCVFVITTPIAEWSLRWTRRKGFWRYFSFINGSGFMWFDSMVSKKKWKPCSTQGKQTREEEKEKKKNCCWGSSGIRTRDLSHPKRESYP